jgi:succinyl-diaminopimelate desuccinylase
MNLLKYETDLLKKLVEINTESTSKAGYQKCASIIVEEAKKNSLDVEIVDGETGANDGLSRPNLIITLNSNSDVTLLMESHFDVVPPGSNWRYPPFNLTIKDGKAYGRGTADNKSGIVAAMGAMRKLRNEALDINIKLLASVDEEVGGRYGVDYVLNKYKLKGDAALVLDAGSERLYTGASGIIWGKIKVEGIQGHAGYPFKAKNAIEEAFKLINALKPYKKSVEEKTSALETPPNSPKKMIWGRFTITMINAGEKENVIPGTCDIRFDRRLLPEESVKEAEKELKDYFQIIVNKLDCKASLKIINSLKGYNTLKDHIFVKTVSSSLNKILGRRLPFAGELGGNDGSFFASNQIPVVCYGTIRADTRYHGIDEFVYLNDLKNVRDLIVNLGKKPRNRFKEDI